MDKQDVVNPYNGLVSGSKKEELMYATAQMSLKNVMLRERTGQKRSHIARFH